MKKFILILTAVVFSFAFCSCTATPTVIVNNYTCPYCTNNQIDTETSTNVENTIQPPEYNKEQGVTPAPESNIGKLIYSSNNIDVKLTGYDPDGFWGFTLDFLIINGSSRNVYLVAENVSVNDYMIDPVWYEEIVAGKKGKSDMNFFDADLEQNKITKVEKIEFNLRICDVDTWDVIAESDTITLTFN